MANGENYTIKVYQTLKDNIDGFTKTPEQFDSLMLKDPAYRSKVYQTLKETIDGFTKTPEQFDAEVKKKGKTVLPPTSKPVAEPLGNGLSTSQTDKNTEIPVVSLTEEEAAPKVSKYDFDPNSDPISLAKKAKELEGMGKTNVQPSSMGATTSFTPDNDAVGTSKEIKDYLKEQKIDADFINRSLEGLPKEITDDPKKNAQYNDLLQNNPAGYETQVAHDKYKPSVVSKITKLYNEAKSSGDLVKRQETYDDYNFINNVPSVIANSKNNDEARAAIKKGVELVRKYSDNPEAAQKNFSIEASMYYGGNLLHNEHEYKNSPLATVQGLSTNQIAALQFIQDTQPEKYNQYKALLIDKSKVPTDYETQYGIEEKALKLEQVGINLKYNAAIDEKYNLEKKVEAINNGTVQVTPEEANLLNQKLEKNKADFASIDADKQNIINGSKYLRVQRNDANLFANELLGEEQSYGEWAAKETGKAVSNTVEGTYDLVTSPLMSDDANSLRQAQLLGEGALGQEMTELPQSKQMMQSFKPVISTELKSQVDAIKSDKTLTDEQKHSKVSDLLMNNPTMWHREGIEGGKSNVGLKSMVYGVTQLAANLAPFIAITAATGGEGGVARFTKEFAAAATTGFDDAYTAAVKNGDTNPYATAMRVTAINSAAMAGAGTASEIRQMVSKSASPAIDKLIGKLSDNEIMAALRQEPKSISTIRKAYNIGKGIGGKMADNVGGAAKITAFTTAGQGLNQAISGEDVNVGDLVKHGGIELLKFAVFGSAGAVLQGLKSEPSEMTKMALYDAATNSESYLEALKKKVEDRAILSTDAEQIKNNIELAKKVMDNVPMVNAKGKELTDVEKRQMLILKMKEQDIDNVLKKDIPKELATKLGDRINNIHEDIDKIYKGTFLKEQAQKPITKETQGTYGIDKETIGVTQKGEPENITKPIAPTKTSAEKRNQINSMFQLGDGRWASFDLLEDGNIGTHIEFRGKTKQEVIDKINSKNGGDKSMSKKGEPLTMDEETKLKGLYKKNFLKQEMTPQEQQEFLDLKNKKNDFERDRELNNPFTGNYANTIINEGKENKVIKGVSYKGAEYSVSISENGDISINKYNTKTGSNDILHNANYGTKDAALDWFNNSEYKKDINNEINSKYDKKSETNTPTKTSEGEAISKPTTEISDTETKPTETLPKTEIKENNEVEVEGRKAFDIYHEGKQVGAISLEDKGTHYEVSNVKVSTPNKGVGTEAYKQLISTLDKPLISDKILSQSADALWRKLEREGLAKYNEQTKQFESQPKEQPLAVEAPTTSENKKVEVVKESESVNAPIEEVKGEELIPDIPKSIKDKIAAFKAKKEGGGKEPLLEDKTEIAKELPIEEKPSLVKIKSKVIEKSEESQKSAKKEGVSLKVQKDDLIDKIKGAMDIALGEYKEDYNNKDLVVPYEKLVGDNESVSESLKKAGFDVEDGRVVFDIEGDGVFKLPINSLDIALSEVEKHWGRKIPERNDLGRSPKLRSIGKYDTIENAEQSKQDALDNLETAKKSGNKKQIELYEAQAKLESDKYKEAFSEYKANKEQIKELEKRIKEGKIESVYQLNDLFKLPELKNKVAEFEGKELPNEKPNYQLAKDILTKSLTEEQSNRDELQKSIYKSNGKVKLNSWKTQGEISNLEKRISGIKEKINEVDKGLSGKEVDTTKFHISEPTDAEVSEVKDIVKDLVKEGHNSLETIQNIVGKEMEDSSTELRTLVEKAFNEYGKEKENTPKSVTKGVIGQVGEWLKKVVGNDKDVTVLKDTKDLLKEADKPSDKPIQYSMKMPDGKILGFTRDGHIYLNGEHLNPNTPIHEAGHIWTEVVKEVNKPLYKKGIELVNTDKGKVYLEAVKNNKSYQEQAAKLPESEREAYYQHEALATAIGDKGAKFVTEARKAAFKEWLNNLWISVKKAAGFKDISANELSKLTFDEYTQKAARDILNNEEIQKEIKDGNITEQQAVEFNANNEPKQSEPTVKSIESKAESENEIELNEAIKEADAFIESQSKPSDAEPKGESTTTKGDVNDGGKEPPKVEMASEEAEGQYWTHINKKEISDAADLANTHPFGESESWKNSVNKGLKKLAKIAKKGESLYDAAKNKVNEWAANVKQEILDDGKSTFNPSDEEIAQMAYHRTMTNKRIAELEPDLTSPIQAVRDAAEIVLSDLEAQKEMVDYVLHNTATTAGRAFNIRQMVSRIDAENGLQIKRMDIIRKQKGQPLSEKQEQEIRDIHDEEAKNAKAKEEYTQKKSQQDFEEAVKAEVDRRMKEKGNKSKPTGNAKKAGNIIRKLKMPKGDARLDITLGGWDVLVEGVAKLVEGGITVAEAVKKMIDEGKIAFKTDKDKAYAIDYIDNAGKHNAIDGIKELAENEKSEMLTKSAVGKGFVNDLVNHYIDKGIKGKELFNEINKDLKEIFPEITEQQVRDAYLKEGEFTLDKKENINKAKIDAKNELRSIAKNETDIADLKDERDLRKREREERQKTEYENKLITEKRGLVDKKALTEKQEKRLIELNKELERIKQRKEKDAKVSNPKDLNRSDKEKVVLDEIKKEKEDWAKEKQAQRDLEIAAKKAQTVAKNEADRLKALTEKRDRLQKGQRDTPSTSTPKVESPVIEQVKAEIKDADKKLREAESEANRLNKEIQAKKDKLSELEANIKRAEKGMESIKTNRKKSDRQIDADISDAETRLKKELNKQGLKLEKGSKAEKEQKQKVADNHNERADKLIESIDTKLQDVTLTTQEKSSLENAKKILEKSKVNPDSALDIFDAVDKAEKNTELARAELANSDKLSDIKKEISQSQIQMGRDKLQTEQDILLQRHKDNLQKKINENERKIEAEEFVEKEPTRLKTSDAEAVRLEIKDRETKNKLNLVGKAAQRAAMTKREKFIDTVQSLYVIGLVGRLSTLAKVGVSALTKQPLNTITSQTFGRIGGLLLPKIGNALRGEGAEGWRKEKNRYMAHYGALGKEGMAKLINKGKENAQKADEAYINAKDKLEDIANQYGKDSKQYKDFEKGEFKKVEDKQKQALLDNVTNSVYEWIGGNSWEDASEVFLHSSAKLEQLLGKGEREMWADKTRQEKIMFVLSTSAAMHGVLKNFSARAEFAASFVARLENKMKQGIDISSPEEILKTVNESYIAFQRGKYQEDNAITGGFKAGLEGLQRWAERHPDYKYAADLMAGALKFKNPIVRTPINIAREAIVEYTMGVPLAIAKYRGVLKDAKVDAKSFDLAGQEMKDHMRKFMDNLDSDKADFIYRAFRKGGFGLGVMALTAMGGIKFGGFFNKDEKKKNEDNGLGINEVEIGGVKLSHLESKIFMHTSAFFPSLLWSNYDRVRNENLKSGDGEVVANLDAAKKDIQGMIDQIPIGNEMQNPLQGVQIPLIGPFLSEYAEATDVDAEGEKIKRKPKGNPFERLLQNVEMKFPKLRQNVPISGGNGITTSDKTMLPALEDGKKVYDNGKQVMQTITKEQSDMWNSKAQEGYDKRMENPDNVIHETVNKKGEVNTKIIKFGEGQTVNKETGEIDFKIESQNINGVSNTDITKLLKYDGLNEVQKKELNSYIKKLSITEAKNKLFGTDDNPVDPLTEKE